MYTFEFIDFFTTSNNSDNTIPLEDIMKQETSYKHTVYVNFIEYISDIYIHIPIIHQCGTSIRPCTDDPQLRFVLTN